MSPAGVLAYLGVFVATVVEGEVVFVAATVLVHQGRLDATGVFAGRRDLIVGRVRDHASAMILACRFLPGLRVAIPAACAYADVAPLRFTTLSLLSSLAWAATVMSFIVWLGPTSFAQLGVRAWWTPLVPAAIVLVFTWWLSRREREKERVPA